MTERDADELLAEEELVPVFEAALPQVKELRRKCLDAEIAAALMSPSCIGKKS